MPPHGSQSALHNRILSKNSTVDVRKGIRITSGTTLFFAVTLLQISTSLVYANVVRLTIQELAEESDLIVIAKVESIRGVPIIGRRWANAKITEILKGPPTESIKYLASPTDSCDLSNAEKGETVLLFLIKDKHLGWIIANAGRGRMLLYTHNDMPCVAYSDIIFSPGTPRMTSLVKDKTFKQAVALKIIRDILTRSHVKSP